MESKAQQPTQQIQKQSLVYDRNKMIQNMKKYVLNKADGIGGHASAGWLIKWNLGDVWVKAPGYTVDYIWDSYAEVIASAIAVDIGLTNTLKYDLCLINMDKDLVVGNVSKNFSTLGLAEFNFSKLIKCGILKRKHYRGKEGYLELIKEIKEKFNLDIQSYLEDTIVLDSIIINSDRNLWNMSIMVDRIGSWPEVRYQGYKCKIYDNGSSLGLTTYNAGEFYEECMYSNGLEAQPFDYTFEDQLKYVRNERRYRARLDNTKEVMNCLRRNFTTQNNRFGVQNPLDIGQIEYLQDLIIKRFKSVIVNKAWID